MTLENTSAIHQKRQERIKGVEIGREREREGEVGRYGEWKEEEREKVRKREGGK